jgi:hypothetical protein
MRRGPTERGARRLCARLPTGDAFVVPAAAEEALEVFYQPYAFASARHVLHSDVESVDDAPLEREAA